MSASRFAGLPDDALIGRLHAGISQAPESELLAAADTLHAITGPVPAVLPAQGCAQPALDTLLDGAAPLRRGAAIAFTVYGDAAPQGSKAYKGTRASRKTGKQVPILVESSKKVTPWRDAVEAAARQALRGIGRHAFPLTGPLEMGVIFSLARPARMPKERIIDGIALPICYPDTSKLLRSTEDALTTAGVWLDDAQVVNFRELGKRYVGEPGALDRPGAVVRVWRIDDGS